MINIRDSEIADILPHTVKTPEKLSLSYALSGAFKTVYDSLLKVRIWQNLDNVDASLLDIIAAEISCPFYQMAETETEKRKLIQTAYEYNSKIGTVEAVQKLVEAAFGTGTVQEWFEYGGEDFYFRVNIGEGNELSPEMYKLFDVYINAIKNKRSKLEAIYTEASAQNHIYPAMPVLQHTEYSVGCETLPYGQLGVTPIREFILK